MARRVSLLPPLTFGARSRTRADEPQRIANSKQIVPLNKSEPKSEHEFTTHVAPVAGSIELRDLARSQADRRHTVIQLELAAAHFETRQVAGQSEIDMPAKAKVWDEFITDEVLKRKKKGRRNVKTQLEALGMYLERRSSVRRGAAPLPAPLKDLRTSELHRFEILRKQVGPNSPREQDSRSNNNSPRGRSRSPIKLAALGMGRRKSVAALPPLLAKANTRAAEVDMGVARDRRRSLTTMQTRAPAPATQTGSTSSMPAGLLMMAKAVTSPRKSTAAAHAAAPAAARGCAGDNA